METPEQTLVLFKPDAVQRQLVGKLIARFERRGLKIVALKLVAISQSLAEEHYAVHKESPFFGSLISYITSSPVIALVLEGTNAIAVVRNMVGATDPLEAAPGTIRGDYALEIGRNLIHASDGADTAKIEISLWFGDEPIRYERQVEAWIVED